MPAADKDIGSAGRFFGETLKYIFTLKEDEEMKPYIHTVQYYETDRMGIAHHSNYVRWMEEARVDFLKQAGWGYEKLEREGIASPVTAMECRYRASTTFPDEVSVSVAVTEFKGAVLKLKYSMSANGRTVFEGKSEHCFLNGEGKIMRMNRERPDFYEAIASLIEKK